MLGIGFKVSDTPAAEVQRALREFLRREYAGPTGAEGGATAEAPALSAAQEDALAQFVQLKQDVDLVRSASAVSRHVLLRYYAQLERMERRFGSRDGGGGGGGGAAVGVLPRLQFSWSDSFCPRKKSAQAGLAFERAAVLFNYGALESQLGVQTERATAEGLKAACRHFMCAAGAFSVVRDELAARTLGARTPDMSAEGLGLLATLMLAQAQACFYEKAVKDGLKDGVKAKLVHQALELYAAALELSGSPALAGTIDRSWAVHLRFQACCMRAATQFWQAAAAKEAALARGEGYGEEIARLAASDAECQEAVKVATQNKLPAALLQSAQALQRVARERLAAAHKDNASVYLEKVPRLADLPPVGKAAMVRPLPPTSDELAAELGGVDLFEQFVPRELLQRAEAVKGDVEAALKACGARVAETIDEAKRQLSALGLPASIEAFERSGGGGVPASVWQRVQHVQAVTRAAPAPVGGDGDGDGGGDGGGGAVAAFIRARVRENEAAAEAAERQLRAVEERLGQEEVEDNVCRQNYGAAKWTRPTSAALGDGFRADVDRYFRLVREARQSDEVVRGKLEGNEALLALLARPKAALDGEMPALEREQAGCRPEIDRLSALLLRLGQLVEEKEQLLSDFRASFDKFDALPLLLSGDREAGADDAEAALQTEKQFFRDHFEGKLSAICDEEHAVLSDLAEANAVFEARRQHDPVLVARQELLQRLSDGVDAFEQLESHLREGRRFYDELAARVAQLHQTVDDHCSARELERRELELGFKADAELRQREARDAELARKMMSDMRLGGSGGGGSGGGADDEMLARRLAGDAPQQYPPPPPPPSAAAFDYARLPPQQQQPPPQQWGGPAYAYGAYQQQAQGGGNPLFPAAAAQGQHGASAPPPPPPPAYGNYYAPQQQTQGGAYAFGQYPGQSQPRDTV